MTPLKNATHSSPGNLVEFNQSDEDFETLEVTSVHHVWGRDYTDTYIQANILHLIHFSTKTQTYKVTLQTAQHKS